MVHTVPTLPSYRPVLVKASSFPVHYPVISELKQIAFCGAQRRTDFDGKVRPVHVIRNWVLRNNDNTTTVVTSSSGMESASEVVRNFYDGINRQDLASVEHLIAQNCIYEDLIFPRPFVGRKAILEFFQKFINSISIDLQFVIDDISEEDASAIGVTWHLEWKGKPFPFSKGCSFYRLEVVNGQRQIVYGRDSVEPAIKPGETALVAIRGVTSLLQKFPQLAERL